MSAEVAIALGVAGRVFANVAFAENPRLGAALVGVFDGFLIHRSWIANTLSEPLTLVVLAVGLVFDHFQFRGFEGTITLLLGCGLGVVLADFGPDVWYEIGGEQLTKDVSRELESLFGFVGDDSASDSDDRSDVGSVVSASTKASASTHRTARTADTGTSLTVRPARARPRAIPRPASTITRLSRVTFDESSISQSQGSDNASEDFETDAGLTTEYALEGDESVPPSASATGINDLYMEPSTSAGSIHTRVRPPSILRRLDIPIAGSMPRSMRASSQRSSSRTGLTSDGETTPRAANRPMEFSPSSVSITEPDAHLYPEQLPSLFPEPHVPQFTGPSTSHFPEPHAPHFSGSSPSHFPGQPPPHFPEPSPSISYAPPPFREPSPSYSYEYPIPPSEPVPEIPQQHLAFPEPVHTPHEHEHEPSRLSRILNVPIVDPHVPEEEKESPESARLWAPPPPKQMRSRSPSPVGPRPPPSPREMHPPPPPPPAQDVFGEEVYITDSIDDSTVDVRDLDREAAIERIEEAWKNVEKKRHRRLNILVRHDDDELQTKKNSTFNLLESLENLRFNVKTRPGIIIITSRSRR